MKKLALFLAILFLVACTTHREQEIDHDYEALPRDPEFFEVFQADGRSLGTYDNLFNAINRTTRFPDAVIKDDSEQVVFVRGDWSSIFLFQNMRFVKEVQCEEEARAFLADTPYTIGIYSNGQIFCANYNHFSHDINTELGMWRLEPNSGGYVYKVSYHDRSFRRARTVIELSQARLRMAKKTTPRDVGFNAYIFFAVQNQDVTFDAGIYAGWENNGEWRVFIATTWGGLEDFGLIVESDYIDGSWIPQHDVEFYYNFTDGSITLRATNLGTGQYIEVNREHPYIGGDSAFIKGTAFVPDIVNPNLIPNLRNGGYLLNVIYRDSYLYRQIDVDSRGSFPFWWDNLEATQYVLQYNTDICQIRFIHDDSGNIVGEVVDIDYRHR